jgi:hypothetical protein
MPINQYYIDATTSQVKYFCRLHKSTILKIESHNGEDLEEDPRATYIICSPLNGIYRLHVEYDFEDVYNLKIVKDDQVLQSDEKMYFETLEKYIEEMTKLEPFKGS